MVRLFTPDFSALSPIQARGKERPLWFETLFDEKYCILSESTKASSSLLQQTFIIIKSRGASFHLL